MQKLAALLLALVLLMSVSVSALAQDVFTMAGYDDASVGHDWETNLFFQRMEEKTGIRFVFSQFTDGDLWKKEKNEMTAEDPTLPEVLFKAQLTVQETVALREKGVLIDLKPYLPEHAPNLWALLEANPDWLEAITLPDGSIAALPSINQLQSNNAMWINTAWLKTLNLEMPTTADELVTVLRAFRDGDPNLNGKQDEVPLTFLSMWDLKYLSHAFGFISNDYGVVMEEDGTVREVLTSDENRAFLTWLNQLWEENLLDHDGFLNTDSVRQITDSDATIPYGMMLAPTPLTVLPADALDQYEMLMPLACDGEQIYRDLTGDIVRGTFAVTTACQEPETLLQWVDHLYTEEGFRLAQAGVENEEYVWNEDGTWTWLADIATVANSVLKESTILEGGITPGLCSVEFQFAYEEEMTSRAIASLYELRQFSRMPCPLVYPTDAQRERLAQLQAEAGHFAEKNMVWFVAGDIPINDDTWAAFCQGVTERGLPEIVSIWQEMVR